MWTPLLILLTRMFILRFYCMRRQCTSNSTWRGSVRKDYGNSTLPPPHTKKSSLRPQIRRSNQKKSPNSTSVQPPLVEGRSETTPHKNQGKHLEIHPDYPLSQKSRAVVIRAEPTPYKAGEMRRWLEEDN